MQQQDAEIQRLKQEIARQRREIEQIKLAKLKMEQKRQDCNLAFRDFEKAQEAANRDQAISLYRKGLRLCPDDDVARYELGKILIAVGRRTEAQEEFEAALRINPDFKSARRELKVGAQRQGFASFADLLCACYWNDAVWPCYGRI